MIRREAVQTTAELSAILPPVRFLRSRRSLRQLKGSVFYVIHVTHVIVFTGFVPEHHQSSPGSDAICSQYAHFVRYK
jgi:hypothetical protein